uniref:Uncharacterized protein n=1 Tax=Oryza glumipatula TaxID=40148 RepID=A0A0D9Y680_9ORYZ
MNNTRQNTWVKEDLQAMDLSSLCATGATGGKSTHVDAGGGDLGAEETKKRWSTYADGGGGSGVKKGEGGGDRRRSSDGEGGGDRRQRSEHGASISGHPQPPGDRIWRQGFQGDHHRCSGTKKRPPELRDEEDPPEISHIRQGREGRRCGDKRIWSRGAVPADGGRGGGRGPTAAAVSTAHGSDAADASSRASASARASPSAGTVGPRGE